MTKLIPKCQYNSGNAFGNLNNASNKIERLRRLTILENAYNAANADQSHSEITYRPSETLDEYINRNQEFLNTGKNQQKIKLTTTPMVRGMSGTDPVGGFAVSMVAMNAPSRYIGGLVTKGVSKMFPSVGKWVTNSTKYATTHPKVMSKVKKVLNVGVAPIQNGSIRETVIGQIPVKIAKLKIASGN